MHALRQNFDPDMPPKQALHSESKRNKRFPDPEPDNPPPPPATAAPTKENALNSPLDADDDEEAERSVGGGDVDAGDNRLSHASKSSTEMVGLSTEVTGSDMVRTEKQRDSSSSNKATLITETRRNCV
jgi:hypothetical protein